MGGLGGWRASFRKRIKPPRRLKFTREGKYFTGMTLLIGFGAINTGNNLLYLLLGMMLSLIIASGILSEVVLLKLKVHRKLPERVYAGEAALVEVVLANEKLRLPSFSIQIIERLVGVEAGLRPVAYFVKVDAGQQEAGHYRFSWPRRGLHRFEGVEVATLFPFDLFRKSRDLDEASQVIVYPRPLPAPAIQAVAAVPLGDAGKHKLGIGGDFYGLREWRQDDGIHSVYWKTTAKRGKMIVREFEQEEARVVSLCLNNRWDPAAANGQTHRDKHEEAIGICAGLAQRFLSMGFSVGLVTLDRKIPVADGIGQYDRILRALALVVLNGDPSLSAEEVQPAAAGFDVSGEDHCVLVTVGGLATPNLAGASLLGEVKV